MKRAYAAFRNTARILWMILDTLILIVSPLAIIGFVVVVIAGLLLLNQQLGLVDRATAVSLGMLLGVQALSQPVPHNTAGKTGARKRLFAR